MKMIDPATGWFQIFRIPTFNLDEVVIDNDKYIDKSSTRVSQMFNNTWLCRYPRQRRVVLDNGSDFKLDLTPLLNYFDIKPVLLSVKNPQSNALVEQVHQVILNMIVTKYFDKKFLSPYYNGHTRLSCIWKRYVI